MTETPDAHKERRHFFGAAKKIAGITMLSRVAGLVRVLVLGRRFGDSRITDAFYLAFMIPNLFRRLFGEGALSAAFVPVFSETAEKQGRQQAGALLANVLALLGLALGALCVLVELGLLCVHLLAPEDWDGRLVVMYTAIMMPFMVTICLLALGSAALNCVKHFTYPAAAPIILNLCIIAAAVGVSPHLPGVTDRLTVVAVSVVVAGAIQLAAMVWLLRAHRLPCLPRLRPLQPQVREMIRMMGPMLIGLGVLQLNALLDKLIAWWFTATADDATITILGRTVAKPLSEGVVTWLNFGERLYQLPLGVLAIALATAVFPLFSRYAARGDTENLRGSVNRALRLAIFEGLPSGVGLALLAGPLASLFFTGGESRFSLAGAAETAHVTRFYGLGMWAFCAQQILLRAFYARKDMITPLKVVCGVVVVNFLLNLGLIWIPTIRHGAFGLSTSITSAMNVMVLAWVLRRRLGPIGLRALAVSVLRIALAAGAMAVAVWQVQAGLVGWGLGGDLYLVTGGVTAGVAAFLLACVFLRVPELGQLLGRKGGRNAE